MSAPKQARSRPTAAGMRTRAMLPPAATPANVGVSPGLAGARGRSRPAQRTTPASCPAPARGDNGADRRTSRLLIAPDRGELYPGGRGGRRRNRDPTPARERRACRSGSSSTPPGTSNADGRWCISSVSSPPGKRSWCAMAGRGLTSFCSPRVACRPRDRRHARVGCPWTAPDGESLGRVTLHLPSEAASLQARLESHASPPSRPTCLSSPATWSTPASAARCGSRGRGSRAGGSGGSTRIPSCRRSRGCPISRFSRWTSKRPRTAADPLGRSVG